jgi:outer membrane protein assembly factor BamB
LIIDDVDRTFSPVVGHDGDVYSLMYWYEGGQNATLVSLDSKTGKVKWRSLINSPFSKPTGIRLTVRPDGIICVGDQSDSNSYLVEPTNGTVIAELPLVIYAVAADNTVIGGGEWLAKYSPSGDVIWKVAPEEGEISTAVSIHGNSTVYVSSTLRPKNKLFVKGIDFESGSIGIH